MRQALEKMTQNNQRSLAAFEAMNSDYNSKLAKIQELEQQIKSFNDSVQEIKEFKRTVVSKTSVILNELTSKLMQEMMSFSDNPVTNESKSEFRTRFVAQIMDAATTIKNLLPKNN